MKPIISIIALGASYALGHIYMDIPHPYNKKTPPLLQVGPLSDEIPYPCQGRYQHAEEITTVIAGTFMTVQTQGSAVHGGGSAQLGVCYGEIPSDKPSDWHIFYSVIGGFPAQAEGNLEAIGTDEHGRVKGPLCGNDFGLECARTFQIPIPKDMMNGRATFSLTWFNKIGNREMYQYCAPIMISGGRDDRSFVDTLPTMFVANIAGECSTGNGVLAFPDPGKYGRVYEDPTPGSSGSCPAGVKPAFEDSPTNGTAPVPPANSAPAPPDGSAAKPPAATLSTPPLSFITVPPSGSVSAPPAGSDSALPEESCDESNDDNTAPGSIQADLAPNNSSEPATYKAPASPSTPIADSKPPAQATQATQANPPAPGSAIPTGESTPSNRPDADASKTPCTEEGALVCLDPGYFGLCNHGFVVRQALAAGQGCVDGKIGYAS